MDGLARTLSKAIISRDYYETRHNTVTDDALVGLLTTSSVVMKHNPPFKTSKEGQDFLKQVSWNLVSFSYNMLFFNSSISIISRFLIVSSHFHPRKCVIYQNASHSLLDLQPLISLQKWLVTLYRITTFCKIY